MMEKNRKNIVLIGFMGCGKSSIGKILSYELEYNFMDTDSEIEKSTGMQISEIFSTYGEPYFRALENGIVNKISNYNKFIIATGGGIVKNYENVIKLKKNSIIVYLQASADKIYLNVKDNTSRPLLEHGDKYKTIVGMLKEREPLYRKSADVVINVSNYDINQSVTEIKNIYTNLHKQY